MKKTEKNDQNRGELTIDSTLTAGQQQERQQLTDEFMQALARLFSFNVSRMKPESAMRVCDLLQKDAAKIKFKIELAPLQLYCSLDLRGEPVELFQLRGGYEKFAWAPVDRAGQA